MIQFEIFSSEIICPDTINILSTLTSPYFIVIPLLFVDNNCSPVNSEKGSCIFLHNWDGPNDSTVGCTAMAPEFMKDIVLWLESEKNPLLIQLPVKLYDKYKDGWELPNLKLSSIKAK